MVVQNLSLRHFTDSRMCWPSCIVLQELCLKAELSCICAGSQERWIPNSSRCVEVTKETWGLITQGFGSVGVGRGLGGCISHKLPSDSDMQPGFIYSRSIYWVLTYYMPGTELGAVDRANKYSTLKKKMDNKEERQVKYLRCQKKMLRRKIKQGRRTAGAKWGLYLLFYCHLIFFKFILWL